MNMSPPASSHEHEIQEGDAVVCQPTSTHHQEVMVDTVRFAPQVEIFTIGRSADLTAVEKKAIWYSREEYKAIKQEAKRILIRVRSGMTPVEGVCEKENCMLGLEHLRSRLHMEQHRINKDMVIECVLNEQEAQWRNGKIQPVKMARVSSAASQWARNLARTTGTANAAGEKLASSREIMAEDAMDIMERIETKINGFQKRNTAQPSMQHRKAMVKQVEMREMPVDSLLLRS
mmetsp:Transcript_43015/g.130953  ORF Transcript_43015/g.130953 Transcript_43015/m.130953 type:complete len:232 (-) Transcript_43015:315-1010(-)